MLEGKVVIVTGVGPGMTRGLVTAAAQQGAKLVVTARTKSFLDDIVDEIRGAGGAAVAVRTDVTNDDDCRNAAQVALSEFGRIDGLVNSAFYYPPQIPVGDADIDQWKGTHDVTCLGAVRMLRAVLPTMRSQGSGAVVNVSSVASRAATPGNGAYAHAKAALNQITRQVAAEEGPNGIRANTIAIGYMMGASLKQNYLDHMSGEDADNLIGHITSRIPLGHIPLDKDCAKPIMFLLSDFASEVTGAILDVNGGEWLA